MKILSYNVALLPDVARFQRRKDSKAVQNVRANEIAKFINESDYDIVCLQEVFDEDDRNILINGLDKNKYNPNNSVTKISDNDFLHEDSGLFVVSKYNLIKSSYEEFHESSGWEVFSDKGILGLHYKDNDRNLFIVNTHLQSDIVYCQTRQSQLLQIRRFLFRLLEKHKDIISQPTTELYVVGDFNVIGESCEYGDMLHYLAYPTDCYIVDDNNKGFTWDGKNNSLIQKWDPNDKDQQRLDYIFKYSELLDDKRSKRYTLSMRNSNCIMIQPKDSNDVDLSDHYGLVLEV
ncbi:MAG: endonuclease/exonuclease/phosphatase family protein [Candidatus Kapaibacterium sp.]|jgi:endonuclease/exonuclease/phosphatase family metal-dependent hydrolase